MNLKDVDIPTSVTLHGTRGALTLHLHKPRVDIGLRLRRALGKVDLELVGSAALWFACATVRKRVPRADRIADQGEAVQRWLVEEGVPESELGDAGTFALGLAVRDLPSLEVALEHAGFSGPTTDGSAGPSSTSSSEPASGSEGSTPST